jgi:hypothetical protein
MTGANRTIWWGQAIGEIRQPGERHRQSIEIGRRETLACQMRQQRQ